MMQDIINEIAEKAVKGLNEFMAAELEKLGYSREYVRAHRYDFITVHINPEMADRQEIAFVVFVPESRILFGLRRRFTGNPLFRDSATSFSFNISYDRLEASEATEEMTGHIMACAEQAREKALEALN